jgi:hypothetical protein
MRWHNTITRTFKSVAAILAVVTLGGALAQSANAGCLQYNGPVKPVANWQGGGFSSGSGGFLTTAFVRVADEDYDSYSYHAEITGLWAFKYISKGNSGTLGIPDGALVDGGNTLWFADGNELTYSGIRDPATGSVCLGVWKRSGERTYELNHIGLSWDPVNHVPAGPAFIKQHVTLAIGGQSYSGTFEITQLKPDGKTPALPASIKGTIEATRVTLNTTTQEP